MFCNLLAAKPPLTCCHAFVFGVGYRLLLLVALEDAPASMNKGSIELEMEGMTPIRKIVDLGVDAQINLARGVIVTNTTIPSPICPTTSDRPASTKTTTRSSTTTSRKTWQTASQPIRQNKQ